MHRESIIDNYQGFVNGDGVQVWLGVPFAAPPGPNQLSVRPAHCNYNSPR